MSLTQLCTMAHTALRKSVAHRQDLFSWRVYRGSARVEIVGSRLSDKTYQLVCAYSSVVAREGLVIFLRRA